ncbi:hypothetical protein G6F22_016758 [Rhizopus arrhizus]|nr:hypothetical protein G6F22_016758 [Rhizopus arrhizus]
MWQLTGFFLTWLVAPGKGRALGCGEVKFTGQVLPDAKLVRYEIDLSRGINRKLRARPARRLVHRNRELLMRRVVITGMGITSCLGNDLDTVSAALREGRSGITTLADHAEAGLRSQVGGRVDLDLEALIDRKQKRFMSDAAAFAYLSMRDAIADAGLSPEQVSNLRTGLIAGSGGGSSEWQIGAVDLLRERGVRKVGPYMVPRTMCSTVSACLATAYQIKGVSYSLTSCLPAAAKTCTGR